MPECPHLARTSAYFDGALPDADHAEALDHVATCTECEALLRDAATFDAVLSQARAPGRRGLVRGPRWRIAALAGVVAASAAAALWFAWPRRTTSPGAGVTVAIELPRERALEARFTGERFATYRPFGALRGDHAHEPIALAVLAELERRGELHDLIAALAATGYLARARELAAALPDDAAGEIDRAALALAGDASELALTHAYHAIERAPELAAGWWNLALAARAQGLARVSRAAFGKVIDRAEPGWADEARQQAAALDRQIAREEADFTAFDRQARAMLAGGPPVTRDDVRGYPTLARIHLLDTLRLRAGPAIDALRPLASELDAISGTPTMMAALERARAADPAIRARFTERYRAVVARTLTPAAIDELLANLRAAGPAVDDLRAGAIILAGQATRRIAELRAIVAPWHDPWFDLLVEAEQIRATWPMDDVRAEAALTDATARGTKDAWAMRTGQLAFDLAARLVVLSRDQDAERWAKRATEQFQAALMPVQIHRARSLLADIHRHLGRNGLARAEFDEVVRGIGDTNCTYRSFALIGQANLALVAGDWSAARTALAMARADTACQPAPDLIGLATAVEVARHSRDPEDIARARAWLEATRGSADDGYAIIGAMRLATGGDATATAAARRWLAAHAQTRDPIIAGARAWGTSTLISDAGARGDWADVLASAAAEHGVAPTQPCVVVATFDDGVLTVAVKTGTALAGEQRTIAPAELADAQIVAPALSRALTGCPAIAAVARPPLHGRHDLLPAALPWAFAGDSPSHAGPGGAPNGLDVSGALPPDPSLPTLAATAPAEPFAISLTGRDATPSRVLAALAGATYAELHVHGVAAAASDDATYLALSPDPDGTFALRADAVRAAKLARAPIVVLAACHAAAVAPYLRRRFSLPDAFLAAGASAVVAPDIAIPDTSARQVFDELHRRVAAGEPIEAVVAAIRARATGDTAWAEHLMVFR